MSADTAPKRKERLPRHRKVSWSRLKWRWPFAVWLLAAVGAAFLFVEAGRLERFPASVEVVTEMVAPQWDGRLAEVMVAPGDTVEANQAVARLDPTLVDQEIAAVRTELGLEHLERVQRFRDEVLRLEEELRDRKHQKVFDQGELSQLREQVAELEKMVEIGAITRDSVARLKARIGGLEGAISHYPTLIDEINTSLSAARGRLGQALNSSPLATGDGAGGAATAIDLLQETKETYTLRAASAGYVDSVVAQAGQVVTPGTPVVTLIVKRAPRLTSFLAEHSPVTVSVGQELLFATPDDPMNNRRARVVSISPHIKTVVDPNSPVADRALRGRAVVMEPLEPAPDLIPGQSIIVRLSEPRFWDIFLH